MTNVKTMVAGNEAGFRVLFECATVGILVVNESGIIEILNSCAENLFGYHEEELVGQSIEVLIPHSLRQKHMQHREKYLAHPKSRPMGLGMELHAVKKGGMVFPVEISLGHYALDGETMAVAFVTDIGERKKMEKQLEKELEDARKLQQISNRLIEEDDILSLYEAILDSAMEIMHSDFASIQFLTEKNELHLLAYRNFHIESAKHWEFIKDGDTTSCSRALATHKRVIIRDVDHCPFEIGKDDYYHYRLSGIVSMQTTPLFSRAGNHVGMISTHWNKVHEPSPHEFGLFDVLARQAADLIERRQAQKELFETSQLLSKTNKALMDLNSDLENKVNERTLMLTQALEREKELSELKSRFVSMASHEFRTPLSVVLSSISLIQHYMDGQEGAISKHILRIKSSINNLNSILNDFLSLDKLEQGKVEIDWQIFNIDDFVNGMVEEGVSILRKGQKILATHSGTKKVKSDQIKLRYVLINLLSNAIKYSPENTTIHLTSATENNSLIISVHDHGIGIPQEEHKHLFDKFFRARNTGTVQGTGLGLTIAKRYVELMGGDIQFVSKENEGTTFTILLPQSNLNEQL